jgi:hypothetical protein
MGKATHPSWEQPGKKRGGDPFHSPNGIKQFRECLKQAFIRKYVGMDESLFQYRFEGNPAFEDFEVMSMRREPETTLCKAAEGVWFEIPRTGQWGFLPVVYEGGINIYGNFASWHPMPIGYIDGIDQGKDAIRDEIRNLRLDATNSVIMRDNLFGQSDYNFIVQSVNALVDVCMTISQLQFLMKAPFIFRVPQTRVNDAKQYMAALADDALYILQYNDTEEMQQSIESTGVTIDPTLFDTFRFWENNLLEQLGIPGAQVTQKRTVQTTAEINLGDDMITLRRQEKFRQRQMAIDQLNKMTGSHIEVISVIDSMKDNLERSEGAMQEREAQKVADDTKEESDVQ